MSNKFFITNIFSFVFIFSGLFGQNEKSMLKELLKEDRSAVDAIVLYPEDVRNHIFEVCQYPELLIKLSGMQEKTQTTFHNYIADYPQQEQAKFYELMRFRGLTKDLAGGEKKSTSEIKVVLKKYPEEIHKTALELGRKEYKTPNKIYRLNRSTKMAFDELLKRYSPTTQTAVHALVEIPEVLSILTDNIDLTIIVGDVYKNEPDWVQAKAKELNLEVARKQAEELEDYKKQLENDPEAYQEMLDAADLYANDNQIPESEYKKESKPTVVYHYPYWYGYPHWHTYPHWSPVPFHYHSGFYIGAGGVVIVVGLPSYHYVHWHYTFYPHRHVHLHGHYHRHYRRHPHSHGGFHAAVNVNINKNVHIGNNRNRNPSPNRNKHKREKHEIEHKKEKNQSFNQFKATDNHRGSWSRHEKSGGGKSKQGKKRK